MVDNEYNEKSNQKAFPPQVASSLRILTGKPKERQRAEVDGKYKLEVGEEEQEVGSKEGGR